MANNKDYMGANTQHFTDIADALREKLETPEQKFKLRDMAPAIRNIPGSRGDMLKEVYDKNDNGIVDDAELVNGHTVEADVPADALFTDTIYDDTELRYLIDTKTDEQQVSQMIADELAGFDRIHYETVEELPEEGEEGTRYLVPVQGEDRYEVWAWINNEWASLGSTSDIDLSEYVKFTDLDERLDIELPKKQDLLTAGENIQIEYNDETEQTVISATDTTYEAGEGIEIITDPDTGVNTINATATIYEAGDNIEFSENPDTGKTVISGTDTIYGAGTGIFIDENNIISDVPYTAGENIEITDQRVISAIIDLTNYYDKGQIQEIISGLDTLTMRVVDELPNVGLGNVIYMMEETENLYSQWVFSQGEWYKVGNTEVSLTDFYTKAASDARYQPKLEGGSVITTIDDDTEFSQIEGSNLNKIKASAIADYCRGTSDIQRSTMPEITPAYVGAVIQYVGADETTYKPGRWYKGTSQTLYAWIAQTTASTYYTMKATPIYNDVIYAYHEGEPLEPTVWLVGDVSGAVMTDKNGNRYTRVSASDINDYKYWKPLEYRTSDFVNDGRGTQADKDYFITQLDLNGAISNVLKVDLPVNKAMVSNPQGKLAVCATTTEELNYLQGVNSNVQTQIDGKQKKFTAGTAITSVSDTTKISQVDITNSKSADMTAKLLFEYMWKKIYPVGSIYTTTDKDFNPGTSFGGTWSHVGVDRVLWGVSTSTAGGSTLDEQLPDIRGHIDWKDGGQAKTEISNGSGAFNLTNKNLGAAYPTGTGASNSARGFDFRASYYNSIYKLGGVVRPNAYTVHFWRRTA